MSLGVLATRRTVTIARQPSLLMPSGFCDHPLTCTCVATAVRCAEIADDKNARMLAVGDSAPMIRMSGRRDACRWVIDRLPQINDKLLQSKWNLTVTKPPTFCVAHTYVGTAAVANHDEIVDELTRVFRDEFRFRWLWKCETGQTLLRAQFNVQTQMQ